MYLILYNFDEEQDVTDASAQQRHLLALLQKNIRRGLQPNQQLTPEQREFPGKSE
jgi:hypothetical protein